MRDALSHASFIGCTGTPIELADANTRAVCGDDISVYDIQRAVEDGATVPIYYESRFAKRALDEAERPKIDPEFEEATEGEEVERKEKRKTKWAQLEAVVGAEKRLALVAQDLVAHFEQRLSAMDGKAMVVCMSRRICVELYRAIVKLTHRVRTGGWCYGARLGQGGWAGGWMRDLSWGGGRDGAPPRWPWRYAPLERAGLCRLRPRAGGPDGSPRGPRPGPLCRREPPDAPPQARRALRGRRQPLRGRQTAAQHRLAGTRGRVTQDIGRHIA